MTDQMYDFKGYKLAVDQSQTLAVTVIAPSRPTPIFKTTSLDEAMRWVNAYRDGVIWAVQAKLEG